MNEPLAALVAAATDASEHAEAHFYERPSTPMWWVDSRGMENLRKALAAIPPDAVLVTEETLAAAIDASLEDGWVQIDAEGTDVTPPTFARRILAALRATP